MRADRVKFSVFGSNYTILVVRDADLDAEQRAHLREFTTPRRALDGSLVWLLEEGES